MNWLHAPNVANVRLNATLLIGNSTFFINLDNYEFENLIRDAWYRDDIQI